MSDRQSVIRRLTQPCLACNRETGWPMCPLCNDLEDAEDRADEHERRPEHDES
jgi:hypothetical protein